MRSFKFFFIEESSAPKKNLHLEHIEDEIYNFGTYGAREAINFLQSLRDMLSGESASQVKVTVKFDGAPALFVGTDPSDGKFFVGTKGVFNKDAKLVKSVNDIAKLGYKGGLADKLKTAFEELQTLGIMGVLQGDMMFTKEDLSTVKVDGKQYTIFQPNTIVYAVPVGSALDDKIKTAEIGIVFHTTYTGDSLEDMGATFGADVSNLKKTPRVWYSDVDYEDYSGSVSMTKSETADITKVLSAAGKSFRKVVTGDLDAFLEHQNGLPSSVVGASIKTYNNSKIRAGEKVTNTRTHAMVYPKYVKEYYETKILPKVKSESGKKKKNKEKDEFIKKVNGWMPVIKASLELHNHLIDAKMMIINKLDKGVKKFPSTFVRTDSGYKVVNDEGYVAIDTIKGDAVKLVDRLEFSYNNFNGIKNWDK